MTDIYPAAGMARRIAALFYDAFLVVAIWMLSTTLLVALVSEGNPIFGWVFQLFLYAELIAFYYAFWRMRGQTLGMQVWKIRIEDDKGNLPEAKQAILRLVLATLTLLPAGLGFFWMLVDRDDLTLYDRWSGTRIAFIGPKKGSAGAA
jgi:uncharacterized RDD family membrane protein YckC